MKSEDLTALIAAREAKHPAALATRLADGTQWLMIEDKAPADMPPALVEAVRSALDEDKSRTVDIDGETIFLQVHNPPWRMLIIGAVHIAQPLARMADLAGYEVSVIDPRGAFATAERFPGVEVSDEWPDEALERLAPDARCAVVTLTHDPKLDDAALEIALRSPAFYIGSLGSKKTHGKRIDRLHESGFDDAAIGRIRGPVGLSIGAKSPAEIAVSILAQIIEARRTAPARATIAGSAAA
jgi:xanthine dehydrogenase accessory factor